MKLALRIALPFLIVIVACENIDETPQRYGVTTKTFSGNWQFKALTDSADQFRDATVPGGIHSDLLRYGVIEDPLKDDNEINLQFFEGVDWQYVADLPISETDYENRHIELEFQGLDTRANVFVNDSLVISADNMFRTWRADVKRHLKVGDNKLEVVFYSPVEHYREQVNNYPVQLPSGCETVSTKVSPFVRKAVYQFGWDWGPRLLTAGIWRPIKLNLWNECRIRSVHCSTISLNEETAQVQVEVNVESDTENGEITVEIESKPVRLNAQKGSLQFLDTIEVTSSELWWPNEFGEQNLHYADIVLTRDRRKLDSRTVRYGVRQVELVQEADSIGTSFYFKINNKPIFIKGANYIPQDLRLDQVSPNDYERIVKKMAEAHMNMVRVWGGGIYEDNRFYQLCDEYGILVWQDFMFAGTMYPIDNKFQKNVLTEVHDNVVRLRNHPCIAIWCGNNEIEVAFDNWGWETQFNWTESDREKLWNGYTGLFKKKLPDTLQTLTPNIPYVSSSPLSNWGNPDNFNHSSMHYWGVWHGREPFENFTSNVPRFMVEYGFQSFPEIGTLARGISEKHMNLSDSVMLNRQKSYIGNGLIETHITELYGEPKSFEDFVNKSQMAQAEAYRMAIKSHRMNKGHCMGTLFWQLNDCWQGPSWSVIDYYGNEKKAYETIKNYYKPIVAFGQITNNRLQVKIVSDLPDYKKVQLIVKMNAGNQSNVVWNEKYEFPANKADVVLNESLTKLTNGKSNWKSFAIILKDETGTIFSETVDRL